MKIICLLLCILTLTGCKEEKKTVKPKPTLEESITYQIPEANELRKETEITKTIKVEKETITITNKGKYIITGKTKDIEIIIDLPDDDSIELVLSNLTIENTEKDIITFKNGKNLLITLDNKTKNKLITNKTAIKSEKDINIGGKGNLEIKSSKSLEAKEDIILEDGKINITSTKDAIKTDKSLYILNTNLTITSNQDAIQTTHAIMIDNGIFNIKTIKDNEDEEESRKGLKSDTLIQINNGEFKIDTYDDAISCDKDVIIYDGNYELKTQDDAIKADYNLTIENGDINISNCNEGLEATILKINNGKINITSKDDGINAKAANDEILAEARKKDYHNLYIEINNGTIKLNSKGDAIDSNGDLFLNGGTIAINSENLDNLEGAIVITGKIYLNGTSITGIGSISKKIENDEQIILLIKMIKPGKKNTKIYLKDKNKKIIHEINPKYDYNNILFTSKDIIIDNTYYLYVGDKLITEIKAISKTTYINSNGKRLSLI